MGGGVGTRGYKNDTLLLFALFLVSSCIKSGFRQNDYTFYSTLFFFFLHGRPCKIISARKNFIFSSSNNFGMKGFYYIQKKKKTFHCLLFHIQLEYTI